jgi:hypothetical protein
MDACHLFPADVGQQDFLVQYEPVFIHWFELDGTNVVMQVKIDLLAALTISTG